MSRIIITASQLIKKVCKLKTVNYNNALKQTKIISKFQHNHHFSFIGWKMAAVKDLACLHRSRAR